MKTFGGTFAIETTNGVIASIEVNNNLQDITFTFDIINLEDGFTPSSIRTKLREHFLHIEDQISIYNMIFAIANAEMKEKMYQSL